MNKKDKPLETRLPEPVEHEIKWSERIAKTLFIFTFINFGFLIYSVFFIQSFQKPQDFSQVFLFMFSLCASRFFFMSREEEAKKLDTWMK